MDRATILARIEKSRYYLDRLDLTKGQREKAEKLRGELSAQLKELEYSDERVIKSINAIREMLKK
ncbi:hypothetical protein [Paenibacillus sp. NEAU-GSW1]|uniref:hypothetical protein n=1 Tax=Paenibacillus sp. NEAU-GSW1 TaxID=2682486 RepID=UPI0012E24B8E|nr:hypothetical protein [Paenibacillus sp. NEAU-GSW1]MUT66035.1 hypothetical protein [Paenibacillus sp. NEAU-GSW1]